FVSSPLPSGTAWSTTIAVISKIQETQWVYPIDGIILNILIKIHPGFFPDRIPTDPSSQFRVVGAVKRQIQATGSVMIIAAITKIDLNLAGEDGPFGYSGYY